MALRCRWCDKEFVPKKVNHVTCLPCVEKYIKEEQDGILQSLAELMLEIGLRLTSVHGLWHGAKRAEKMLAVYDKALRLLLSNEPIPVGTMKATKIQFDGWEISAEGLEELKDEGKVT